MTTLSELVPVGAQAAALRATFALPKRVRRGLAGKPIRLDGQESWRSTPSCCSG